MLVVVNQPHIDSYSIKGNIPQWLIESIRGHYSENEYTISSDEDVLADSENFEEMDWYKETKANMTPGTYLRIYRKRDRMSQKDLAEKLGVTKQAVSGMEHDRRGISKEMAKKLAEVFETSPARFI